LAGGVFSGADHILLAKNMFIANNKELI
jgi:hypothetical protein